MPAPTVPAQWTATGAGAGMVADNWLATFHDDQLNVAVAEAIAHNADLRVAAARVEQAMLYAKLAGAKLYPSVDFLARGGGKMSGDGSGIQGGAITVSWELDLWGRVRYGRAAAAADAASAQADFEYARQSIAALVATQLVPGHRGWPPGGAGAADRRPRRRAGAAGRNASARRRRQRPGRRSGAGQRSAPTATRSVSSSWRASRRSGRWRSCSAAIPPPRPASARSCRRQPAAVPAGLPSELLERRPDVVAAERRVAAAFNRVGEAKAARLPTIALTTGVSSISSELFVLQDHDNPVWNLGASLLAPIYRGGALKTQVEIRTVEQKQAVAAYASVGLRAFGEVENALSAELAARDRERILARNAVPQPARPRDRADAVQGRQHRPSLRQRAAARPEHDERGPHPRPGRAARPARQSAPGARRKLRTAAAAAGRRSRQEVEPVAVVRSNALRFRSAISAGRAPGPSTYIVCDGNAISVPARATTSVMPKSSCSCSSQEMIPVAGAQVGEDLDVERRRAKAKESHAHGVPIGRAAAPRAARTDAIDDGAQLRRRRLVAQADDVVEPELVARRERLEAGAGDLAVRAR